jgi:hypothetical protein
MSECKKVEHIAERFPGGATAALTLALEEQRRELQKKVWHHPMPLVLALQFCPKDEAEAMKLARLLTDIEPEPRQDVAFLFATQAFNTPLSEDVRRTILYTQRRFPTMWAPMPIAEDHGHPDGCFELWSATLKWLSDRWASGEFPYTDAFLFEADGAPTTHDWIDRLKTAHEQTIREGKRVTGPRMSWPAPHVNGSAVWDLTSLWRNTPSLWTCRPGLIWDMNHSRTLLREAGSSHTIMNPYGADGLSESMWAILGHEHAWITSIKDGFHHHWARKHLARR